MNLAGLLTLSPFLRETRSRVQDVIPHHFPGSLSIVSTDRRINFLVVVERLLEFYPVRKLAHAGEDPTVNYLEKWLADSIAAGTDNRIVKSHVGSQSFFSSRRLLHGCHGRAQGVEVFRCSPFFGPRSRFRVRLPGPAGVSCVVTDQGL